ncbi:hypothetical protein [Streptomyces sp. NPDC088794]|uniref:hypothetical protein n=1 Tax=Streptomyces sp. NPDC088794 TaxID=3365902 RepID=UPI0037F6FE59
MESWALAFLALGVTAVVFLLWYAAVERLGAGRAGLFNGLIPFASLLALFVTGAGGAETSQIAGAALVLVGVVIGLLAAKRDNEPSADGSCRARRWPRLAGSRDLPAPQHY